MKFTQGLHFRKGGLGTEGKKTLLPLGQLQRRKGNERQGPKQTRTRGTSVTLPLTQSVVDAIRLFLHRLVQTFQILHKQRYHLPVHLRPQESK